MAFSYLNKTELLKKKLKIAQEKKEQRHLKWEIAKTYFPFQIKIKYNKLIVAICIGSIISYTVAALLLQKNIAMEISPTLTTCVYAFFGTELLGMAGIKIVDTKFNMKEPPSYSEHNILDDDTVG